MISKLAQTLAATGVFSGTKADALPMLTAAAMPLTRVVGADRY